MTEKQYRKADSMVLPTLLVVMVGIFFNMLGMLGMSGPQPQLLLVTGTSVVGVVASIIIYIKLKGRRICGMLMCGLAMLACLLMIVFVDAQFFYMLVAALFIAQMAYLEKKRIIVSAIIILPIYTIKSMLLSTAGGASVTEVGTSIVILILIIVSAYNITKIWIAFNTENMSTVKRVSEELVTHFDEANGYIETLDEAINTSNMSMQDIATNIENTAHEIQNQSLMCQDIENNTQNAKAQTDVMVQASSRALEEVALSAEAMEKLHNHARVVESENKETVAYVATLNERTKAVKDILGTISGISTRTHLLALNASIEAARAEEAGKGFEVVADEVRALSEQTQVATRDIDEILTELGKDVERVTASIGHSVEIVEEQNSLIEETKAKFDTINTDVKQLMDIMNDFRGVIEGITEASTVIADVVTDLSASSEEVAATSGDGTTMMTKAVEDMNQVKSALTNIYNLAQNLRDEYNVE